MKTVVRNKDEKDIEVKVKDTYYVIIPENELEQEEISSSLFFSKDLATDTAMEDYEGTTYVAEIKLITKVVG